MPASAPPPDRSPAARLASAGLLVWAVGTQLAEAVVALGVVLALVGAALELRRTGVDVQAGLRRWWPLWLFAGWCVAWPALGGKAPTALGLTRLGDLLILPLATVAWSLVDGPRARRLVVASAAVLLAAVAFSAVQHYGLLPAQEKLAFLARLQVPVERVYEAVPGAENRYFAGGFVFHRLRFAHVAGLLVVVGVAAAGRANRRDRWALLGVCGAALVAMVVFAEVRAAAVVTFGAASLAFVLQRANPRKALAGAAVAAVVLGGLVLVSPARARFLSAFSASGSGERPLILSSSLRALGESVPFGLGLGRMRIKDWIPRGTPGNLVHHGGKAHDQYLSYAIEAGVPAGLLFALLLVALARRLRRDRWEGVAALAAIAWVGALSLVHDTLFHPEVSLAFTLIVAAGLAASARKAEEEPALTAP